jgi:DNA-binding NarL/FixJ family response regulator
MNKTKIACVEDNPKLRKHWVDELSKHDDFEVIFEADDETEMFRHFDNGTHPDFLVLDLRLNDKNDAGIDVLKWVGENRQSLGKDLRIIVCSNYADENIIAETLMLGARAFVLKGDASDITKAIRVVQQEEYFITKYAFDALLKVHGQLLKKTEKMGQNGNPANLPKLDSEQLRMLKYLCSGLTYKEIADREKITEKEVERKRDKLCLIFDATNRYDLIYKAAKMGLDRQIS